MIKIFKVAGHSMYPDFKDGDRIVCIRKLPFMSLHVGQSVVFEKSGSLMIKAIKEIKSEGVHVQGTDPYSTDSRTFGLLEEKEIQHIVWFKI